MVLPLCMFAKDTLVLQAPKGRRVAAAPAAVRKTKADAKPVNPLYEKRNKHFGEFEAASTSTCRPIGLCH